MTTPNLGNELDAIFKPEWLAIVHTGQALAQNAEGTVKTELQTVGTELQTALSNAASQVQTAQAKIDTTINPLVNDAITAAGTSLAAAYPPFAPLIKAGEGEVEQLADAGTDAIAARLATAAFNLLSNAAKSNLLANLTNAIGAG